MAPSPSEAGKTGSPELAQLIRERRQQLGMSRQDLAEATGVPYSTIAQIETAYRGVSPGRLGVIARALQLDPKELYDVLAREPEIAPLGAPPTTSQVGRADGPWHTNPAYVSAGSPAPAPGPDAPDIVDRVVDLLSRLPSGQRLEALADAQRRVVAALIEDEVLRTREAER